MTKGILLVISAPSGCGKGTVIKELLARNEDLALSVSATTRLPRPGEEYGVHYFFMTKEEFIDRINIGDMLEHAKYVDNYYGTPKEAVERKLSEGINVILEIEVKGAMQVKNARPDAVTLFILPPSFDSLRDRLVNRGTESIDVIEKRLAMAKEEMTHAADYDYIVVNDDLQEAVMDIETIIRAEKLKTEHQKDFLNEVLNYDA